MVAGPLTGQPLLVSAFSYHRTAPLTSHLSPPNRDRDRDRDRVAIAND
jgi:hypothetical protein